MRYSILDPTGNITALVEDDVDVRLQPSVADSVMRRHDDVEQVGFLTLCDAEEGVDARLRMAGGEFCGNASLCAALLCATRRALPRCCTVTLRVSGAKNPVEVKLEGTRGTIRMPSAFDVGTRLLCYGSLCAETPVVCMEGISHAIIRRSSPLFSLLDHRGNAEAAIKDWCRMLGVDGLGLMFLGEDRDGLRLTPLVYVPGSNTVFWENSCASGSTAVGIHTAVSKERRVSLDLHQPGGALHVESDPETGKTCLTGSVRVVSLGAELTLD